MNTIKKLIAAVAIVAAFGVGQGTYASSPGTPDPDQVLKVCSQEAQICYAHLQDLYDHGLVEIEQIDADWIEVAILEENGISTRFA